MVLLGPWFERFFEEPETVLLWHPSEEPFSVPDGSFAVLRAGGSTAGVFPSLLLTWFWFVET